MTTTGGGINIDIYAAGNALLQNVAELMTAAGVELPARQGFLPGGLVSFDDEQLTVQWIELGIGQPGADSGGPLIPASRLQFYYHFEITLLRLTPTISDSTNDIIPDQVDLTQNAAVLANDAEQLLAAIVKIRTQEILVPMQHPMSFGPLASIGPEGILAGCRLPVNFTAGMSLANNF